MLYAFFGTVNRFSLGYLSTDFAAEPDKENQRREIGQSVERVGESRVLRFR